MLPDKIVFASANAGKIREVQSILKTVTVLSLKDVGFSGEIEETGSTFEENSYIKAKAVYDFCHLPTLADDSGLCVDALNGAPGVFSARYDKSADATPRSARLLLLKNLEGVSDRNAKFVCVATYIDENGKIVTAKGETHGSILTEEHGDGGFGYDCVFYSYDLKKSFGEADFEEKNAVSHRYRALEELKKTIESK
ncbi:MAG: RdgB/HAM1 family non-canonical purine NTP pyrophosphatase [Clostridia bacterium]|nr:RdgB/HAM1 family non-canonical purine NTP pyrophosphatase [Clostridia bacterium]